MTDQLLNIAPLRTGGTSAASELLAAALHDDPGWRHGVHDAGRRRAALRTGSARLILIRRSSRCAVRTS